MELIENMTMQCA